MHDIMIVIKSMLILAVAWFTELAIASVVSLTIVPQDIREFFIETKEIINWIASILVVILTVVKIIKEKKK